MIKKLLHYNHGLNSKYPLCLFVVTDKLRTTNKIKRVTCKKCLTAYKRRYG
jgi:hypothetical protein